MPTSPNEYLSQDDEAELKRHTDLNGVGEAIYMDPDQIREYAMGDFGMNTAEDRY